MDAEIIWRFRPFTMGQILVMVIKRINLIQNVLGSASAKV